MCYGRLAPVRDLPSSVLLCWSGPVLARRAAWTCSLGSSRFPRNLAVSERFEGIKFPLRDRGSNFTASFDAVFRAAGTRILRTTVQAPRMSATCERLVSTLRREILDRVLILGEAHLHTALTEYQVQLQHGPAAPGNIPARPRRRT